MNKKKIIILSAVIVALLGILMWVMLLDSSEPDPGNADPWQNQTSEKNYEEAGSIYRCSIDSISRITVSLPSESFTFVKNNGTWTCDALPGNSFNSSRVSSFATNLGSLKYVEEFDEDVTPEACGITEATPSVGFTSDIGEVTLRIAESFNDVNLCYVAASVSNRVYSVKAEAVERFLDPLNSYRSDSVPDVNADSVSEIVLSNAYGISHFQKGQLDRENAVFNEWRMLSPVEISASDSAIHEKLFDSVNNMKISGYASDNGDFEAFGLGAKDRYLSFKQPDGKTRTIYFGSQKDGMYYVSVDNSDSIYSVEASMLPFVEAKPIDLADRHIKLVMKDSLSAINVKSADAVYDVKVSPEKNKSSINGTVLDETEFSQNVFTAVCGLVADDLYTGNCTEGEITVTFTRTDGTSDRVEFSTLNDRYYAVSENGKSLFMIQKSRVEDMLRTLEQYK